MKFGRGICVEKRPTGKFLIFPVLCALLSSCETLPGDGPLATAIMEQAEQSRQGQTEKSAATFDVVNVNMTSARLVSNFENTVLQRRFGIGGAAVRPVIGVGDELRVTIYEAAENGLFSTTESKQTVIDIVVQPNGKATLPYVGELNFRGRTLEQARQAILNALNGKAIEPDVIVANRSATSRTVSVSGAVGKPSVVPLGLRGETIMEVMAKAGGPSQQPYESYVTLVRGQLSGTALLKSLIDSPKENIFVQAGDQVFLTHDPRTFTILGAVNANNRIPFGANEVNLLEAVALAKGASQATSDMKGYFIYRFEEPDILMDLLGPDHVNRLIKNGMQADRQGRYPVVYRFDMSRPDSLMVGQIFPIKNRDVIYASRHPSIDFIKFMKLIETPVTVAARSASLANDL